MRLTRRWFYGMSTVGAFVALLGLAGVFFNRHSPDVASPKESARAATLLEALAAVSEQEAFARPSGPWRLTLPFDHGAHPGARTETWMIAAHLKSDDGETIGVNFSLSRFGLREAASEHDENPWALRSIYRAHVSLARGLVRESTGEERFSRGAGAAGHDHAAREVWLDHWQLSYGRGPTEDDLLLSASVRNMPIRLVLTPIKSARQADADGVGPARGYSMTRMKAKGSIGSGNATIPVSGLAWLDRLWGELPLSGGPLAYDRLVLQLDDGKDVSLVRSRRRDGKGQATVDGLVVGGIGEVEGLSDATLDMEPIAFWKSPSDGVEYPIGWRISGKGLGLTVTPLLKDQTHNFVLSGWSGVVLAEGVSEGVPVQGLGTLQLSGYEN